MARIPISLCAALTVLCGCNVSSNPGSGNEQVSIKADGNGQVSFNLPFAKGALKLPDTLVQNGHVDIDGVQMIPGGRVHGFSLDAGNKGALVHLSFDAPRSPQVVRDYFMDQFKQRGDQVSQAGNAVSGRTKDGNNFVIHVEPAPTGSTGTIQMQSKD